MGFVCIEWDEGLSLFTQFSAGCVVSEIFGSFRDPVVPPYRGRIGDVATVYLCWDAKERFLQPLALPRASHSLFERCEITIFTDSDLHGLA